MSRGTSSFIPNTQSHTPSLSNNNYDGKTQKKSNRGNVQNTYIPTQSHTPSLSNNYDGITPKKNNRGNVQNSIFTFPTPPRNSNNQQRKRPPENNKAREYELLKSQTLLLVGTASTGFVLFLLFTLPIQALIGLTILISSLGACVLVATSAIKTKYQLELEHPLGLVRHLPEKIREHLTEVSLHDCLSPSGSMESLTTLSQLGSKDSLSSMSQNNSVVQPQKQNQTSGYSRQRRQRTSRGC